MSTYFGTIYILCRQRDASHRWVGSEKWQFLLIYSTIYADIGGPKKGQKHAGIIYGWSTYIIFYLN